jgi:hypothetical protein
MVFCVDSSTDVPGGADKPALLKCCCPDNRRFVSALLLVDAICSSVTFNSAF